MATPTNTSVSRTTGEDNGTSSEDGSNAGKTEFAITQVGLSPGSADQEGCDCAGRNTGHEDTARGTQNKQVHPCPGPHEYGHNDAVGGSEAEQG